MPASKVRKCNCRPVYKHDSNFSEKSRLPLFQRQSTIHISQFNNITILAGLRFSRAVTGIIMLTDPDKQTLLLVCEQRFYAVIYLVF